MHGKTSSVHLSVGSLTSPRAHAPGNHLFAGAACAHLSLLEALHGIANISSIRNEGRIILKGSTIALPAVGYHANASDELYQHDAWVEDRVLAASASASGFLQHSRQRYSTLIVVVVTNKQHPRPETNKYCHWSIRALASPATGHWGTSAPRLPTFIFWATVCKNGSPYDICLSVCPVCDVGVL